MSDVKCDYTIVDKEEHVKAIASVNTALHIAISTQKLSKQQEELLYIAISAFAANMSILKLIEYNTHLLKSKVCTKSVLNKTTESFSKYYSKYTKPAIAATKVMLEHLYKVSNAIQDVYEDINESSEEDPIAEALKKLPKMSIPNA